MGNYLYDSLIAPHESSDAVFLVSDNGEELTFGAFFQATSRMSHALVKAGVGPGDRIVVQAPKTVEMVVLYAACLRAGAVFLPLNTAYTTQELAYFITDADPALLICSSDRIAPLETIAKRSGARVYTLDADGSGTLGQAAAQQQNSFETVARGTDDLAALLYTSGTTGRSKGAMLSHDNLLSNAQALVDLWQITDADTLLHALPIFHTHGLFVALNTALLAGTKVRFMAKFDADAIVSELPRSTLMMGVPTFYTRLLDDARLTRDLVTNMRLFISGSAPLLAETHVAFEQRTGMRILERYGMTETNMITSNPVDGPRLAGTVGRPLPGTEIALTSAATGEPVEGGAVVMIEVRGPNVFKGYWKMPEKTAEELRDTGFFITGDLGRLTDRGYLQIVGRVKDLIISGGYNIYPKEVEDVLNDIDGIVESAVFGVPHADFGEAVIAAVIMDRGLTCDTDAIQSQVAERLARFKHPRRIIPLDVLPRNTMGKVQKNVLRAEYAT
ncbi:MAG: malonyl-CoA synthase [Pseudomonadota bacterium]